MSVRVRYAPSPTGSPHVGNIRDALFKHLFAKHHGGVNILRIEDTDRTRYVEGAIEEQVASLNWLGIEWQEGYLKGGDHGPYVQSERKEQGIYEKWIKVLLESGHAYLAFETPEELEEMRDFQKINKQQFGYFGGEWRDATPAQVEAALAAGKVPVIRQKVPHATIVVEDYIRGRLEFDGNTVDDPVLIKTDGMPTYHFAAMVDDHLMGISHIMRGEEWISSAPKHAALFDAFGWERPIFVHSPVIKGKDGAKLSKRHGDTRCLDYRSAGYLGEALVNFIALIGWAPGGDRELMNMNELIEAFDLDGLQPAPGVFDLDKLNWMNGHYMRANDLKVLVTKVKDYAASQDVKDYWSREDRAEQDMVSKLGRLSAVIEAEPDFAAETIRLEQERVTTLPEFAVKAEFFYRDDYAYDPAAVEKWLTKDYAGQLLSNLKAGVEGKASMSIEECEALVKGQVEVLGQEKLGPIVHPTRVALTGQTVGPGLFELMAALGPAKMSARFDRALALTQK